MIADILAAKVDGLIAEVMEACDGDMGASWAEDLVGGPLNGRTIEDLGQFQRRFYSDREVGETEPEVSEMMREWVRRGVTGRGVEHWVDRFRQVGYRGWRDGRTVWREVPEHPMLMFRLATNWDSGLSWGMDRRSCAPGRRFSDKTARWWAAIVEPRHVMAHIWANPEGFPLWETVENRKCGPLIRAFDDCSEVVVDPAGLRVSDTMGVGNVVCLADAPGINEVALESIRRFRAQWAEGLEKLEVRPTTLTGWSKQPCNCASCRGR